MTRCIEVRVGSYIELNVAEASDLARVLERELRLPNPKWVAADRQGRPTRHIDQWVRAWTRDGNTLHLPRGAVGQVRRIARELGIEVACDDQRAWPSERIEARPVELRDYQEAVVDAIVRRQQGVVQGAAGMGKTRSGVAAIGRIGAPALVVVNSLDLVAQWRTQVRDLLGVEPSKPGEPGLVTVATIQTLARWSDDELDTELGRYGTLVVDECHHAASPSWRRVIERCPARYRVGLSATPEREDGLGPMVSWLLGPVIAKVDQRDLIESGHLVAPKMRVIRTDFEFDYREQSDYAPLLDALVADDARNRLIVDEAVREAREGASVLVLSGRVDHCELLADALVARGVSAVACHGGTPKKRREAIMRDAREGRVQVLVATQLADEGLDIPRLSRVVLAFPGRAEGRIEQRIGRVMRPHAAKGDAVVIDIVDHRVGILANQARKRRGVWDRLRPGQPTSPGATR